MARRTNHYEFALEQTLMRLGTPLLPIDEARIARAHGRAFKNFDYIVYRPGATHWLVEVKGRRIPHPGTVNCWMFKDDVTNLDGWRGAFGEPFEPVFAFVFALPPEYAGQAHMTCGDHGYQVWLLRLCDAQAHARERSRAWGTLTLSSKDFKRVAVPLLDALPEHSTGLQAHASAEQATACV